MITRLSFVASALCLTASGLCYDLGSANQFNAFIFGNAATSGGHADGAVAVGGNWTGSGYDVLQHNNPATVGMDNKVGMIVGGFVNYTNGGSINNSGNARVKGNFFSQNTYNVNGGTLFVGGTRTGGVSGSWSDHNDTVNTSLFTSQQLFSQAQSTAITGLGGELINTADPNNWAINVASQTGTQKVYKIAGTSLSNLRTLAINGIGANDTVIINVTGSTVGAFGVTVNTNTGNYNKILWNFGGSSFDVKDRALHGSLLAPWATVDQRQNIDGTLVANNWNNFNSQELHHMPFTGTTVPEPATLAVLGLGALAAIRRRRAK